MVNELRTNYQLDQSELARQNQITQQILANYLERKLFGGSRAGNQKIPTIDEILPKPTQRPKPRGFASSSLQNLKRGTNANRNRFGAYNKNQKYRFRGSALQKKKEEEPIEEEPEEQPRDQPEDDIEENINSKIPNDEIENEAESLQSVESEQYDRYYSDIFSRDPHENEIDSGKFNNSN
ncbi:uncharacterized protein LOC119681275 [Teleopsis dalmanni]|uniref:uncharacterized protein LOC119681275 n=1 Tax=Teleopsis dalmanni TaxID=139649 RepID=UPI0018CCD72B|nr:uncharacterized protein LOC119681275 [Teleopsis dalmanni]